MNSTLQSLSNCTTATLFLITLSYYVLLFLKPKPKKIEKTFNSLTVVIPCHNEESYIEACITSVQKATFSGLKEILVMDDGSTDTSGKIVAAMPGVTLIKRPHGGKAAALNAALAIATGDLVAVIDGDSEVAINTLEEMKRQLELENTVATSCPNMVKNRQSHVLRWLHIEQLYTALLRSAMVKLNANAINSGMASMFRKKELIDCGGFSELGLTEDVDVAVRLIQKGHQVSFAEGTYAYTNMPTNLPALFRQRIRWMRGQLTVIQKHARLKPSWLDCYTIPLILFSYLQALIMGFFTLVKIATGYNEYFLSHGVIFSLDVALFIFNWISIAGLLQWTLGFFTGANPPLLFDVMLAVSSLLSYALYIWAILKYDRRIDMNHLIPLAFMAPYWWTVFTLQSLTITELFRKPRRNIWTKTSAPRNKIVDCVSQGQSTCG